MKDYINNLMIKIDFSKSEIDYFIDLSEKTKNSELINLSQQFVLTDCSYDQILTKLKEYASIYNIHLYSITMLFYLYCSYTLEKLYKKHNIPNAIFLNTMRDLKCKLLECENIHGIMGTFVGEWYVGFFKMQRFGIGRLQFEHREFKRDIYTKDSLTIEKGDTVYNIHIPSMGPLTKQSRLDSYKKAYTFYQKELKGGPMVIVCSSWLLYPDNKSFYPNNSNIISFMDDFDYIWRVEKDSFDDGWRIFGKDYKKPVTELPQNTSLQRAYVGYLLSGKMPGLGYGIKIYKPQD